MAALYTLPSGSAKLTGRTISSAASGTSGILVSGTAVLELDTSTVTSSGAVAPDSSSGSVVADDAAIYINSCNISASGFGAPAFVVRNGGAAVFGDAMNVITAYGPAAAALAVLSGASAQGPALGYNTNVFAYGSYSAALYVGADSSANLFQGQVAAPVGTSVGVYTAGQTGLSQTALSSGGLLATVDGQGSLTLSQVLGNGTGILVQNSTGNTALSATLLLSGGNLTSRGDAIDLTGANANVVMNGTGLTSSLSTIVRATAGSRVNIYSSGQTLSGQVIADETSLMNYVLTSGSLGGSLGNVYLHLGQSATVVSATSSSLIGLDNLGMVSSEGGTLTIAGNALNGGVIGANNSTVRFSGSTVSNTGHLTVGSGGNLWVQGSIDGGDVLFADGTGTLRLDNSAGFRSTIGGFQPGDLLDFGSHAVSFASPSPYSNGSLHLLVDGAATSLSMPGSYPGSFHLGQGSNGDAVVFYTAS